MPKCALTERLKDPKTWIGTDDDVWYMRWRIPLKFLFAFSYRCPPGLTFSFVFLPGFYLLPFTIWFTGWSWWYCFPLIMIPVTRQWRKYPITLLAIGGGGKFRLEDTDGSDDKLIDTKPIFFKKLEPLYFSRCQYWCRWHFRIHWPLSYGGHFYFKKSSIPVVGIRPGDTVNGKLVNGYRGWDRDGDEIFWGDGGFAGTVFK
jgi:hypothetical protein